MGNRSSSVLSILKSIFGYDRFLPLQQEVIECVLSGKDCLAVMPTGGGKSLCYQIPALLFDGLTVVVSPLISLMKDQVEQLTQLNVPAVLLNSAISPQAYRRGVERVRLGRTRLLYVAPETLLRPNMLALIDSVPVSCLAIDEAHCISEWGHDFRPEYRQLATVRCRMPQAVCIALTATATPRVRQDIRTLLGFDPSSEFVASFNRENLFLRVVPREEPLHQAIELLRSYPNESGIIYCATRKEVDTLCAALRTYGFSVCPYHAGLADTERARNQDRFARDEVRVVVATIAFGMGIDKSNVRFVLHFDLPKNIESYYQEIGRAGRDGMRAECVLLFSYGDLHKIRYFMESKEGTEKRAATLQLSAMVRYAESDVCRRIPLLGYFDEHFSRDRCGMCDNCLAGERELKDITLAAQKFLSCVKRTGERFGVRHIIRVLRGSKSSKVLQFGHDKLSTYGIGMELSEKQWEQVARHLLHKKLMVQDPEIGGLSLTQGAWDVFRGKETVFACVEDSGSGSEQPADQTARNSETLCDPQLFETLRRKRMELAQAANVPPYVVFSDKTLAEMAAHLPRTPASLLRIHGVGQAKLDRYGATFLEIIEAYCREHAIPAGNAPVSGPIRERKGALREMRTLAIGEGFNAGSSVESLAQQFTIRESRVLQYLLDYARAGHPLRPEGLRPHLTLPGPQIEKAMAALEALGPDLLRPIFDALEGEIGYEDLKLLRLYHLSLRHPAGRGVERPCSRQGYERRIVCLANSRKYSGRCIAGKEWSEGGIGGWIRPVRGEATGELSMSDITLRNGKVPDLLDILTVPLRGAVPHTYQSENHLVGEGCWAYSGKWAVPRTAELCDDVDQLWINGFHSQGGLNDRLPLDMARECLFSSLLFIRPESLAISVDHGPRGLNKIRAKLVFKGEIYWLSVTDPVIEASYLPREVGSYPVEGSQPYVTVSIGEPFEGFCYKLAAGIILQPSEEPWF